MITNTQSIKLDSIGGEYGSLIAVEESQTVPFEIKRIYFIYDVAPNVRRGFHSHVNLWQALICVHGSVKVEISNPFEKEEVLLDAPSKALIIGPMVWREMFDFQPGSVLLVLASEHFDESDYIRNHELYLKMARSWYEDGM